MLHPAAATVPDKPPDWPLLSAALRPFYLLSAIAAAVAVPVWLVVLLGPVPWPAPIPPVYWHAHEMVFGFAAATVSGFLLGAKRAWTGLGTSRAAALGALALLWLAGRLALFAVPYPLYAVIDLALLPIVGYLLTRQMRHTGLMRNLPLAVIVLLLALTNLLFHLSALRWLHMPLQQPLHAALALLVLMQCVMAGRVIAGFTISATRGMRRVDPWPALEKICLTATAAGLASWVAAPPTWSWLTALLLAIASFSHGLRQWRWRSRVIWQRPMLWILHAAYLWITLGLALLAFGHLGWPSQSAAIHALGVGATGGLIIGMMTRTARGHAGRRLKTSTLDVTAYGLVMVAALVRVAQPLAPTAATVPMLVVAGAAWSSAFTIFLWQYTPLLVRGRPNE